MSNDHSTGPGSLLPTEWDVPSVFRERLGRQAGRQRCMTADGHLLLVLHEPPRGTEASMIGRFFWRRPEGAWHSNSLGDGIEALAEHLDQYDSLIEQLEEQDVAARTADEYFGVVEQLIPLHRSAENLYLALQAARENCPKDRRLIDLRDQAYEVLRSSDLLLNDAKSAMDYAIAKRAEEQARYAYQMAASANRLNTLIAMFLPVGTISAIFGMNVRNGLEEAAFPWAFAGVILIGVLCGLFLKRGVIDHPVDPPKHD